MCKFKILKHTFRALLVASTMATVGCSDFFENDLTGVVNSDTHNIATDRAAFYQLTGILQQMQRVGDGYFISNELRGDLLTQTRHSTQELRDIEFFDADTTNSFLNERKYYALVNNCNFYIDRIDRGVFGVKSDTLVSAAKTIRAWAYLQLALDYGKVHYFTQPLLSVDDQPEVTDFALSVSELADAGTPMLPAQLVDMLIADLEPYTQNDRGRGEVLPFKSGEYSSINGILMNQLCIPVRFMLGELYMWRGDFEKAANMYHRLMIDRGLSVAGNYANKWRNTNCDYVSQRAWKGQFSSLDASNMVTVIPFSSSNEWGMSNLTDLLYYDYRMGVSAACRSIFDSQQYTVALMAASLTGDLRGEGVTSDYGSYITDFPEDATTQNPEDKTDAKVTKIVSMNSSGSYYLPLCRSSLVYLRYAEAVNRLGKHELAMAVLKYGLTPEVLNNGNYIRQRELKGEPYTDFGQINQTYASIFRDNKGLHSRGSGDADLNPTFVIDTSTGEDSLTNVENKILDEYVLECAFEGHRFHDLMRVSQYRGDASVLASRVAAKLASLPASPRTKEAWEAFLMNRENWFLPSCVR